MIQSIVEKHLESGELRALGTTNDQLQRRIVQLRERLEQDWAAGMLSEGQYRKQQKQLTCSADSVRSFQALLDQLDPISTAAQQRLTQRCQDLQHRISSFARHVEAPDDPELKYCFRSLSCHVQPAKTDQPKLRRVDQDKTLRPLYELTLPAGKGLHRVHRGYFTIDHHAMYLSEKRKKLLAAALKLELPASFRRLWIDCCPLGELMSRSPEELCTSMKTAYAEQQKLATLSSPRLYEVWTKQPLLGQVDMLVLLLMGSEKDQDAASGIYDAARKAAPQWTLWVTRALPERLWQRLRCLQQHRDRVHQLINAGYARPDDERQRIEHSGAPPEGVKEALDVQRRIQEAKGDPRAEDRAWLRDFHGLPFGRLPEPVSEQTLAKQPADYLDELMYGQDRVKQALLDLWYSEQRRGQARGLRIILVGEPGTGKTMLAQAIATLFDRPLAMIPVGGCEEPKQLLGFKRAFHGTTEGEVTKALRHAQSMGPVIVWDEIGQCAKNVEPIFRHAWDPNECDQWQDHYFGFAHDLSYAIQIGTCNSLGGLSEAVKDRARIFQLQAYEIEEKLEIAKRHLLPRIARDESIDEAAITFSDAVLRHVCECYDQTGGARKLEENCQRIITRIARLHDLRPDSLAYPYNVTLEDVGEILG